MKDLKKVYAPEEGTVYFYPYALSSSYGNFLIIDHGKGIHSLLGHLKTFNPELQSQDPVKRGDFLGFIGNSSKYKMPIHLHWSVFRRIETIWDRFGGKRAVFSGKPYRVNRKQFSIDPADKIAEGWDHPCIGKITSPWGPREMKSPFDYHYGIDYSMLRLRKEG